MGRSRLKPKRPHRLPSPGIVTHNVLYSPSTGGGGGVMAETEVPDNGSGTTSAVAILAPAAGSIPVPAMGAAAAHSCVART
jgi:hypothetical protein